MATKEGIRREAESGGCHSSNRTQLDTFFTVKHTQNCIDTLDREAIHSSPTEHTPSPRFDSYCLSHDPLSLPAAISTLSVQDADLVSFDLTNEAFSSDPGQLPEPIPEDLRNYWIREGADHCRNKDGADFSKTKRDYANQSRYLNESLFQCIMAYKEFRFRKWLIYSPSTNRLYCFCCRLLSDDERINSLVQGSMTGKIQSVSQNTRPVRNTDLLWLGYIHFKILLASSTKKLNNNIKPNTSVGWM